MYNIIGNDCQHYLKSHCVVSRIHDDTVVYQLQGNVDLKDIDKSSRLNVLRSNDDSTYISYLCYDLRTLQQTDSEDDTLNLNTHFHQNTLSSASAFEII